MKIVPYLIKNFAWNNTSCDKMHSMEQYIPHLKIEKILTYTSYEQQRPQNLKSYSNDPTIFFDILATKFSNDSKILKNEDQSLFSCVAIKTD